MSPIKLTQKHAKLIRSLKLTTGKHESLDQGACIMELVSYINNEPWSDRPQCACPVITAFCMRFNDKVDDETRQRLKPFIWKIVGTRDEHSRARAEHFVLGGVTRILPLLTDALKMKEVSLRLRSFKAGQWAQMREYVNDQREAIKIEMRKIDATAATYAAYATAATAATYAAYAAYDATAATYAAYATAATAATYAKGAYVYATNWQKVRAAILDEQFVILDEAIDIGSKR